MFEIKAYQCVFCKKYSRSKSVMKKHELKCFHNLDTKSCATCANCVREHYKVDKAALPFDYECDVYSHRPMCKADQIISHFAAGMLKTNLRSNCKYWIKKEEGE